MSEYNLFELVALIKAAKSDPSAIVDALWEAGYRQPERSEKEAVSYTHLRAHETVKWSI